MMKSLFLLSAMAALASSVSADEITRLWLTHQSHDPHKIVINWLSDEPGDSVVRFGLAAADHQTVRIEERTKLHHVEIPIDQPDATYHYTVSSGKQRSRDATFKSYPSDVLRVAVVADWQSRPDLDALRNEDVHLLLTAGDNIANLWQACGEGTRDCVKPYVELIETYPELFRSTPFMPALGNHDREIRRRGSQPPAEPVYDVDATAFRSFFALPEPEWAWYFDLPDFNLRLIALDLNHISDFGTTWQSCHDFGPGSEQLDWYQAWTNQPHDFVVTLYNERNASVRQQAQKRWQAMFQRGTCCISGFGYFAERAEAADVTYYNTSLSGKGKPYRDPESKYLASQDSYLLLTIERAGPMVVEIKGLNREVLDRRTFTRRSAAED